MKLTPLQFGFGLIVGIYFLVNALLQANAPGERAVGEKFDRTNRKLRESSCEMLENLNLESEKC